jgi:hypothetical protein
MPVSSSLIIIIISSELALWMLYAKYGKVSLHALKKNALMVM